MQNNYYFLRKLSQELAQKLGLHWQLGWEDPVEEVFYESKGLILAEAFSQNKDELILGFAHPEEDVYIRANLESRFTCLSFPENFARARKNSIDLFSELLDLKTQRLIQFQNERSFVFEFEQNYQLLFKMHGRRANILLFQSEKFISAFHKKFTQDQDIELAKLDRPIEQTWSAFERDPANWMSLYPTLERETRNFLKQRLETIEAPEAQWEEIQKVVQRLEKPRFYVSQNSNKPQLSLLAPESEGEALEVVGVFEEAMPAINIFYRNYAHGLYLEEEKKEVLKNLHRKLKQGENYLNKNKRRLEDLEVNSRNEETANILMANLHQIPTQAKEIELFDFYQNISRKIKLKADLSPQKNAENYYRKAKNEKIEIQTLKKNIQRKEKEIQTWRENIQNIRSYDNLKVLRKYLKNNRLDQSKPGKIQDSLFKKFHYLGWDIWVGKNAKNNDLLTQQYAKKDDLWLHAKDVSGSHVVIKQQSGKSIPPEVLEKAASLAAYYSKRSSDTLCPVLYTPRKFVRKTKDLAPGQVIVEKEEVIMVSPEKF